MYLISLFISGRRDEYLLKSYISKELACEELYKDIIDFIPEMYWEKYYSLTTLRNEFEKNKEICYEVYPYCVYIGVQDYKIKSSSVF